MIKSSLELHSAVEDFADQDSTTEEPYDDSQRLDSFGTLAIHDDGGASFYGRSAGSEVS